MIYIYALRDPVTGSIRYIGKTKNIKTRLLTHISKAKAGHTDHHCAHWITTLLARGLQPELVVINELPIGADWKSAEIEAIRSYRAAGHDLTNLTGGGDGFHDCQPDVLKRRGESRSKTLRDPVKRAEFVNRLVAARSNPEVRLKQSESSKASWSDAATRQRMLDGMKRPEAIKRRADATRLRMHNPAAAAQHQATMKLLGQDPVRREKARLSALKRWSDPDARAKQRAQMEALYSDPERRKAASVASNKRWDAHRAKKAGR